MKKWSVVLLCALMVLSRCGGGNSKDAQSSAAEETLKAAEAKMDERTSYLKTYHTEGTTLGLNADKDGLLVVESAPYDSVIETYQEENGTVRYAYQREYEFEGGTMVPMVLAVDTGEKRSEGVSLLPGSDGEYALDSSTYGSFVDDSVAYNELKSYTKEYWEYKDCFSLSQSEEGDDIVLTITCVDLDSFTEQILAKAEVDVYDQQGIRVSDNRYTQFDIKIVLDADQNVKLVEMRAGKDFGDGLVTDAFTTTEFSELSDPTYTLEELKQMMEEARA